MKNTPVFFSIASASNDSYGVYGSALHYSMVIALVGSAFLIFLLLWKKGRLDMDEDASLQMMKDDMENSDEPQ